MEHKLLRSYVTDFANSAQINNLPEHKQFEYFTNFSVITSLHPEAFSEIGNLADVDVDQSGTFGIDAIALLVNNSVVESSEDIDVLAKSNYIDAKILFIQSKTSKSIDSGDVLKFLEAVKSFLAGENTTSANEDLLEKKKLIDYLYTSKIAKLHSNQSPKCQMIFSFTGGHEPEQFILDVVANRCNEFKLSVPDIKDYSFDFYNADRLIDTYKQVENQFEIEVRFKNNLPLDSISGVEQAYIGYMDAREFLKLITDPNDQIRRNVFYDNVRDFQGLDNTVNTEINTAILDASRVDKFVLYNNGVTAVAGLVKNLGSNRFLLRNYQIVNGCQTSNVLFINRASGNIDSISIPIKIVHTTDSNVVSEIIKANNRQTPVPSEAFVALEDWHKKLQEYIAIESKRLGDVLFYERRSKEFTLLEQAPEKKRVITLHSLVRSYTSVFLQRPHSAIANNPTGILKSRSDNLFNHEHLHAPYFASAFLMFKLGEHFEKSQRDGFVCKHRYHVAMLYAVLIAKSVKLPAQKSKQLGIHSDKLVESVCNKIEFDRNVTEIGKRIHSRHGEYLKKHGFTPGNPPMRSAGFTEFLLKT